MADEKNPGGPPPGNEPPPYGAPPQGQPYPGPPPQYGPPGGQSYPQQGYPPPGGQPPPMAYGTPTTNTTVVVQQPMGAQPGGLHRYHTHPAMIVCQFCNATVTTSISYETGLLTWIIVGVICLFGCWLGCCLIPFCVDACKDVVHSCPNCKQTVGKHRQIS